MIIVVGGEKGGTGKTTLATNLAALHVRNGNEILLVDTDVQGSASDWAAARDGRENTPRAPAVQKFGKSLAPELKELARKYQDVLVDAGGRDSVELRAAMTVAEKLYIPVQASQFDVWTLDRMEMLVTQARAFNPALRAYIILNRAPTHHAAAELQEARELLSDLENCVLLDLTLHDRVAYRKAARAGLAVVETPSPDPKAVREMQDLYAHVFTKLSDETTPS